MVEFINQFFIDIESKDPEIRKKAIIKFTKEMLYSVQALYDISLIEEDDKVKYYASRALEMFTEKLNEFKLINSQNIVDLSEPQENELPDQKNNEIDFNSFVELLKSDDARIKIDTIKKGISSLKPKLILPYLKETLFRESDQFVISFLVKSIGYIGSKNEIPLLVKYLKDQDPRIRANAIEGLEFIKEPEIYKHLVPLLRDKNPRVIANAAKALQKYGRSNVVELLEKMIKLPKREMRDSAIFALAKIININTGRILLDHYKTEQELELLSKIEKAVQNMIQKGITELENPLKEAMSFKKRKIKEDINSSSIDINEIKIDDEINVIKDVKEEEPEITVIPEELQIKEINNEELEEIKKSSSKENDSEEIVVEENIDFTPVNEVEEVESEKLDNLISELEIIDNNTIITSEPETDIEEEIIEIKNDAEETESSDPGNSGTVELETEEQKVVSSEKEATDQIQNSQLDPNEPATPIDENVIEIDTSDTENIDLSSFIEETESSETGNGGTVELEIEEQKVVSSEKEATDQIQNSQLDPNEPATGDTQPATQSDENVIEIDTSDTENIDLSSFIEEPETESSETGNGGTVELEIEEQKVVSSDKEVEDQNQDFQLDPNEPATGDTQPATQSDENVIEIDTSDTENIDLSSFIEEPETESSETGNGGTVELEIEEQKVVSSDKEVEDQNQDFQLDPNEPATGDTQPATQSDENVIEIDTSDTEDIDLSSWLDDSNDTENITEKQEEIHPIEVDRDDNMIELEDVGDVDINNLLDTPQDQEAGNGKQGTVEQTIDDGQQISDEKLSQISTDQSLTSEVSRPETQDPGPETIVIDDSPEIEIITASEEEKEKDMMEKEKLVVEKKAEVKESSTQDKQSDIKNDDDPFSGLDL